jgi:hypothetical protein
VVARTRDVVMLTAFYVQPDRPNVRSGPSKVTPAHAPAGPARLLGIPVRLWVTPARRMVTPVRPAVVRARDADRQPRDLVKQMIHHRGHRGII